MDAKGVRNMQSILVVVNKHNTARVASCWFIIYYISVNFVAFEGEQITECNNIYSGKIDNRMRLYKQLNCPRDKFKEKIDFKVMELNTEFRNLGPVDIGVRPL